MTNQIKKLIEEIVREEIQQINEARTFAIARADILSELDKNGWNLSPLNLKIPHATSPDGDLRLWFKTQAVYFTKSLERRHNFKNARTISYDLDIRKVDPAKFVAWIQKLDDAGNLRPR